MFLKNIRKGFSLFLCITVVLSFFVGCSDVSNSETYYAFCGFAGVKENTNNEFYYLKKSVSNSTTANGFDETITVEECYFDATEKTLIIDLIYNDIQNLDENKELEPVVLIDGKETKVYKWHSEIENTAPTFEKECHYSIRLQNVKRISGENKISVCIGDSQIDFNLDKQIGTTNPNDLGVCVQELGNGLKLVISDGSYKNKKGFYLSVISDKSYYDMAVITKANLTLKNKDASEDIICDMNLYSSVLGEANAIFCCDEEELIEGTIDFSTCSFLYDMDVQYSHIIEDTIDIDIVNSDFPISVSRETSKNKNIELSIDKKTENDNVFIEISELNSTDFEDDYIIQPDFHINVINRDEKDYAQELEEGKHIYDVDKNMEKISLEIIENNFHEQFSGEIK